MRKKDRAEGVITKTARLFSSKNKKQAAEFPESIIFQIQEGINELELKSWQNLFDYLIVSGVIYLKREIIEMIEVDSSFYRERFKKMSLAKLNKEKVEFPKTKKYIFLMYPNDFEALAKFCVEKNVKKFWIFEILFKRFAQKDPVLIQHVSQCKKFNVSQRKKKIDKLMKVEYISMLSERDANEILERNTTKYDNNEFSGLLQVELKDIMNRTSKAAIAEKIRLSEEEAFNQKINRLRTQRNKEVDRIADEYIDSDLDE